MECLTWNVIWEAKSVSHFTNDKFIIFLFKILITTVDEDGVVGSSATGDVEHQHVTAFVTLSLIAYRHRIWMRGRQEPHKVVDLDNIESWRNYFYFTAGRKLFGQLNSTKRRR